MMDKTAEAGR